MDSPGFHPSPPQREGQEDQKEGREEGSREEEKHREVGKEVLIGQGEGWLKVSS